MPTNPKIPAGYGSLKGQFEVNPDIDLTKPIYDQVFNSRPRFLDHSLTEEETEKMVDEIAADMRRAMKGKEPKPADDRVSPHEGGDGDAFQLVSSSSGFKIMDGSRSTGWIWVGGESDAESQRAISVAMKAFAALCRQGIETVELDGETIDLWDVKRDLRALLGPDEV